jgi:hypothetical protein
LIRDNNKTVTELPVLVPCQAAASQGFATFLTELNSPLPVRALSDSDLNPKSKSGREALRSMQEHELERFNAIFAYMAAIDAKDAIALGKAAARFSRAGQMKREHDHQRSPSLDPKAWVDSEFGRAITVAFGLRPGEELKALERYRGYRVGPHAESNPNWRLSLEVSDAVRNAQLVLWWTGERFLPALYCADLKTAIHVKALLRIIGGKGFRVCPYCDKPFFQDRSNQNYCCLAHRECHRVARWRAKQKAETKGRNGRTNVTHKAR